MSVLLSLVSGTLDEACVKLAERQVVAARLRRMHKSAAPPPVTPGGAIGGGVGGATRFAGLGDGAKNMIYGSLLGAGGGALLGGLSQFSKKEDERDYTGGALSGALAGGGLGLGVGGLMHYGPQMINAFTNDPAAEANKKLDADTRGAPTRTTPLEAATEFAGGAGDVVNDAATNISNLISGSGSGARSTGSGGSGGPARKSVPAAEIPPGNMMQRLVTPVDQGGAGAGGRALAGAGFGAVSGEALGWARQKGDKRQPYIRGKTNMVEGAKAFLADDASLKSLDNDPSQLDAIRNLAAGGHTKGEIRSLLSEAYRRHGMLRRLTPEDELIQVPARAVPIQPWHGHGGGRPWQRLKDRLWRNQTGSNPMPFGGTPRVGRSGPTTPQIPAGSLRKLTVGSNNIGEAARKRPSLGRRALSHSILGALGGMGVGWASDALGLTQQ